jgi:membrane protease YdiL (CAAX protease family)
MRRWRPILLAGAVEGGLGLVALLIGGLTGCWPLADLTWDPTALGWGVLATLPMLLVFVAVERWAVGPLKSLRKLFDEVLRPFFRECSVIELAVMSLLAGVGEELLFRGLLQRGLDYWLGASWPALVLASVIFGLFHALSVGYIAVAVGLGLFLGGVWLWSGNLLVPIVAHALYDFVVLVYLLRFAPPAPMPANVADQSPTFR